jgi:hypothetical protein
MKSMHPLRKGVLAGAPLGYVLGLFTYGGIGYLVAGATGLWAGVALATVFAAIGLRLTLRYVRAVERLIP